MLQAVPLKGWDYRRACTLVVEVCSASFCRSRRPKVVAESRVHKYFRRRLTDSCYDRVCSHH